MCIWSCFSCADRIIESEVVKELNFYMLIDTSRKSCRVLPSIFRIKNVYNLLIISKGIKHGSKLSTQLCTLCHRWRRNLRTASCLQPCLNGRKIYLALSQSKVWREDMHLDHRRSPTGRWSTTELSLAEKGERQTCGSRSNLDL